MELLVYMAIVGVVVVIAGEAFSNSTRFRIRTDNMVRATQEAENVATIFKEDVATLGSKSSREQGDAEMGITYGKKFRSVPDTLIYMDPCNNLVEKRDSSSFRLETKNGYSDFTFRRVRYSDSGFYQALEEIRWYVEKEELKRSCKLLAISEDVVISPSDPCQGNNSVVMATGVKVFKVMAAMPDTAKESKVQIFPPSSNPDEFRLIPRTLEVGYQSLTVKNIAGETGITALGGSELTLSGFATNYKNSDGLDGGILPEGEWVRNQLFAIKNVSTPETDWSVLCDSYGKVTLRPDTVYEISFELKRPVHDEDKSLMFVPGRDHMSVGFRKAATGDFAKKQEQFIILHDFMFFPPMDPDKGAGKRTMRFTVPERVENVCLTFTFACFSPLAAEGEIKIKDLKLKRVASASYKFVDNFNPELYLRTKKNVKAFNLQLQVSRGAKRGGTGETGNVDLVIATPSNGPRD